MIGWLNKLRYTKADSGPIGYKTRIICVAIAPFAPLLLFDVNPRASSLTEAYFFLASAWMISVGLFGAKQLWHSVWSDRS